MKKAFLKELAVTFIMIALVAGALSVVGFPRLHQALWQSLTQEAPR